MKNTGILGGSPNFKMKFGTKPPKLLPNLTHRTKSTQIIEKLPKIHMRNCPNESKSAKVTCKTAKLTKLRQ